MAMTVTIWHNPRCSKSRGTLALLKAEGIEPEIRLYLKDAPSEDELRDVLGRLGKPASDIVRTGETRMRELGLNGTDEAAVLIAAMSANPILIERPIVIIGDRAAIGRPPEAVLDIL